MNINDSISNERLKREKEEKNLERYRRFSYGTNQKLSRLSHEELMIPLVYWNSPPQHRITAMYVQKSIRSGNIIITGSQNGAFIIWKPSNILHNDRNDNKNNNNDDDDDNKWEPIAMTFSTNTSPIISILGSFQHKEQAAFMACHADGETVIFSVYGAGALKIGCGERPIISESVSGIYGYGLSNESYQHCVVTNLNNNKLHLIDLHKGREMNYSLNSQILAMKIIDITFFELQLSSVSSHCAMIDERGKITTFSISESNNRIESQLSFESRLKHKAINIGITFDNKYLCAISNNEFVIFSSDPLRFISYIFMDEMKTNWDGMIVLDKYLYGIINTNNNKKNKIIEIENNEYNDDEMEIESIRPFFILLWHNNSMHLTVYLVSRDCECILTPVVYLCIPHNIKSEWSVVTNDNLNIFVATKDCKLITFSLDSIESVALQSMDTNCIGSIHGYCAGSINDGFINKECEEEDIMTASHLNITAQGVLLCCGYCDGSIYIYSISSGEAVMEIHTKLCSVNCLLLLCCDRSFDGVLFAGYNDGFIEAFNVSNGDLMMSYQCHYGSVSRILWFSSDYYVFSIGSDNALCSFLVFNQLVTMDTCCYNDNIRINWYRGHSSSIVAIYRNEWCLISDLVCCSLSNGEIYVWCVSTSQLERRFSSDKSLIFNIDRGLYSSSRRNSLPHLRSYEMDSYNNNDSLNVLILDIRVLGYLSHVNGGILSDILSLLLDYGLIGDIGDLIGCLIGDIAPCYGYCGDFDSLSLLFPFASSCGGRWRIQPKVSAVYMLSINTICMWLLQCVDNILLPICSSLVTFYHCQLPESFNGFVEPSRNSMARYCLNSVAEIRCASRMLLHGIVQRMDDEQRLSLICKWRKRFCINGKSSLNNNGTIPLSVLLGAIVICVIHSLKRQCCDDCVSQSVIKTLISVLMEKVHTNSDMIKISLSCDYLGKVIISWFKYVSDVEYLLSLLLDLRNCDYPLLKKSASTALLQCGVAVPQSFIKTMGNEALNISFAADNKEEIMEKEEIDKRRHEQALMCIINLVQKYPQVLLKHIPLLVSTIIRCLDPSAPRRRKALLSATTASLHVLVTKYPNVAFHQETQHFAIGTGPARDNCILIYDLRTTTRWKQLKGHRAAVTAIQFNYNGEYLISYSAYERPPTVKCWNCGSNGFFNSLLSINSRSSYYINSNSKCIKTCPMPPLDRLYPPIDHLQYTKLTWNQKVKGAVKLQRENKSVLFFTVLPK